VARTSSDNGEAVTPGMTGGRIFLQATPAHRRHYGQAGIPYRTRGCDARIIDDQCQPLDQGRPATCMVADRGARVSFSLSSDNTGNGKCSLDAILGLIFGALCRQPKTCLAPAALSSANRSRKRAGLRRAARALPGIMSQSSTSARSCRARRSLDRQTPRCAPAAPPALPRYRLVAPD